MAASGQLFTLALVLRIVSFAVACSDAVVGLLPEARVFVLGGNYASIGTLSNILDGLKKHNQCIFGFVQIPSAPPLRLTLWHRSDA